MRDKKKPASPGRPKDEDKRRAILKAAGKLFMKRGMAGTTMDEIANKADVSKLTVYNHYGSKEGLFEAVIRSKCEGHTGDHIFDDLTGKSPDKELYGIGMAFIGLVYSSDAIALHRIIMSEGQKNPEMGRLFYAAGPESLFSRFSKYLEKVEKHCSYRFPDKRDAAGRFFCLFKGELHMRALLNISPQPTKKELKKMAKGSVEFFLKAFSI
ncbi:MAG: TetR/AcrR family transcriptional regulator [Alphaproteobacteria bacterium]|jgi:TetR/AcrR family transcriptional repressor of mexJK operon|nr:TetR/AcrR family transcriptional regulator [Alphaproteobacteria bacterium]QQS58145.1 MAG: TetR/AcrR family transcriptional regulator [Alphaproteobacteria bacterium]